MGLRDALRAGPTRYEQILRDERDAHRQTRTELVLARMQARAILNRVLEELRRGNATGAREIAEAAAELVRAGQTGGGGA